MPYKDPEQQKAYQRLWVKRRRDAFFEDKACVRCGSSDDLEVDHEDPAKKVDHRIWSWSQQRRETELTKCQVLCNDCHKAKTADDKEAEHGTNSRYTSPLHRCRCGPCKGAHARLHQQYRANGANW